MLGFVPAHIPWNAISNLELRRSYKALRDHLVLPSATILSNIGRREYALTVDAIPVPILLRVSFHLISVTTLCDIIIHQCMCKGWIGHANVLGFNSH